MAALGSTLGIFFGAQTIAAAAVGLAAAAAHLGTGTVSVQFMFAALADGLVVAGVALMLRWLRWRWADIGLSTPKLRHLIFGLLAAVPYYILYAVIVLVVSALVPSLDVSQKQELGFNSVHGALPMLLAFLSLVVFPPLAEEIAMRGFLYTGLKKWLPKLTAAIVVSALFGAAHLAEGGAAGPLWIGAIDTFTLSLVLLFLREQTGNLWAGIVLHALKNGIAFVTLFVIGTHQM